ncbi:CCGSCS motif protein [Sedimenticola sp.]|uniref:CCGSCS motif protein n=1 Tax=Sedimenticola sp. TaxID=1940285 RepID=UPI003D1257AE
MSEDSQQTTPEASAGDDQPTQATAINVNIQVETAEEKKEAERPGFCCGSCS